MAGQASLKMLAAIRRCSFYGLLVEGYVRNRCIHLPDIRCEFGKINAKYQMHVILRELATPGNQPIYPMIDINEDILSKSLTYYSNYIKSKFMASYSIDSNYTINYYTCDHSN